MLWHHKCYCTKVIILQSHVDLSSAMGKKDREVLEMFFSILYLHSKQTKIGEEQI